MWPKFVDSCHRRPQTSARRSPHLANGFQANDERTGGWSEYGVLPAHLRHPVRSNRELATRTLGVPAPGRRTTTMDSKRFDELTSALANAASRRKALKFVA